MSHSLTFITADTAYIVYTVNSCMAYTVQHSSVVLTAKGTDIGLFLIISDDNTRLYCTVSQADLISS